MKDILLDNSGDLIFENGDLKTGEADDQNVSLIFRAHKGELRSSPSIGFGAPSRLKKIVVPTQFKRDLKVELERDKYPNARIEVTPDLRNLKVEVK